MKHLLYHGYCYDGFGAAWAFWKTYGAEMQYHPMSYGKELPAMKQGEDVFIADFSFPRQILLEMKEKHPNLFLLDHHISAQKDLEGLSFVQFDMNKSGAALAWDYLYPSQEQPPLIKYIMDRDLWRFQLPHSREISEYISNYDFNFEEWNVLDNQLKTKMDEVINIGGHLRKAQLLNVKSLCSHAQLVNFDNYQVPCVNSPLCQSDLGHELLIKYPEAPFSLSWFVDKDKVYNFSFRSRGDFDVSELAKKFGGGGHKAASGCSMKSLPDFLKI